MENGLCCANGFIRRILFGFNTATHSFVSIWMINHNIQRNEWNRITYERWECSINLCFDFVLNRYVRVYSCLFNGWVGSGETTENIVSKSTLNWNDERMQSHFRRKIVLGNWTFLRPEVRHNELSFAIIIYDRLFVSWIQIVHREKWWWEICWNRWESMSMKNTLYGIIDGKWKCLCRISLRHSLASSLLSLLFIIHYRLLRH